jgi:AcrR family transcriptional regulator
MPTAVEPHQRTRLLDAMARVVGEQGYASATVADAVRGARVSRGTFYALFPSKEACFLESYRHRVDVVIERIDAAVGADPGDWRSKLRTAMRVYLAALQEDPRFARAHLFEIHAAGRAAGVLRDATIRRFADRYRASFTASGGSVPSDAALFVLSAGVDQLVCAHVREHGAEALPELEDALVDCAISLGGPPWT